jgi:hypothetical protein
MRKLGTQDGESVFTALNQNGQQSGVSANGEIPVVPNGAYRKDKPLFFCQFLHSLKFTTYLKTIPRYKMWRCRYLKKLTAIILCILLCTAILISGCNKAAQKPVPAPGDTSNSGVQQTSDADKREMASNFSNIAMTVDGVQKATIVVSATATAMPQNTTSNPNSVPNQSPANNGATTAPNPDPTNVPGSDTSGVSSTSGEIPDVTSGRLVVMVGLNLNAAAMKDQNQVNKIKEEVKAKIMGSDPRVSEVLVTTNPDMIKKLQDVAAGVIQGKPLQSYAQDINELDKGIRAQ